jgi:hypothetical protein
MSGTLLVLLGMWGALIPFVGPYFDFAYTPDNTWNYTQGRLVLEILPGLSVVLGGLLVLGSANRAMATFGGWLAALGGAWFVLGLPISTVWDGPTVGEPIGSETRQVAEYVGFFGGVGVGILFLAAFALGRFAVLGVREVEQARADAVDRSEVADEPVTTEPSEPPTEPDRERETEPHNFPWRRSSKHASVQ